MNQKFFFVTSDNYCTIDTNGGFIALCYLNNIPRYNLYQLNYNHFANNKIFELPPLDKTFQNPFTINLQPLHINCNGVYEKNSNS